MTATLSGSQAASNRVLISSLFLISFSLAVRGLSPYTEPCRVAKHAWSLCQCLSSYLWTAGEPGLERIVWPVEWTSSAETEPQRWFLPLLFHIPTVTVLVSPGWCRWCTGPNLGPRLAGLSSQVCWHISLQSHEGPPSPTREWPDSGPDEAQ